MHRKMARKGVSLGKVFDARALRVVVDDQGGRKLQQAIEACYAIQPAVHRLWRPIRGELDDYIFNPKPSGYQSLHSAVLGGELASSLVTGIDKAGCLPDPPPLCNDCGEHSPAER